MVSKSARLSLFRKIKEPDEFYRVLCDPKKDAAEFLFIAAFLAVEGWSKVNVSFSLLDVTVRSVLLIGVLLTYSPIPVAPKLV